MFNVPLNIHNSHFRDESFHLLTKIKLNITTTKWEHTQKNN